jgi:hypothetical protein
LAAFVGIYPYLPAINPPSLLVGVDVTYARQYAMVMKTMFPLQPGNAMHYVFSEDIPVYLLTQYVVSKIVNSPDIGIRLIPVILSVLLVSSSYWFVSAATGDRLSSITVGLFAAVSFQITAGISGGLYANWLAVSEVFVFLALFATGLKKEDRRYVFPLGIISLFVQFTHPWTWFLLVALVVTYGLTSVLRIGAGAGNFRTEVMFVVSILLINFIPNLLYYFASGASRFTAVYQVLLDLNVGNVPSVVASLDTTLKLFLAGAMANPMIIILGIIGVLTLSDLRSSFNRLLLCWVAVIGIAILLSPNSLQSADLLQSRVFYLVPFQIFSAIGFLAILRFLTRLMTSGGDRQSLLPKLFVVLAYVAFLSFSLSFALRTVGYLYSGIG